MRKKFKDVEDDEGFRYEPMAVQVARETLSMHNELQRLREENKELREYRRKYSELLDSSIAHSSHMMGGILKLVLVPGVLEACAKNASETPD